MPVSHVDYSADLVEHVLSSELVVELENALLRKGRFPEEIGDVKSIHPIKVLSA